MVKYGNEARQWWAMFPGEANAPWIVECIGWMDGPNAQPIHANHSSSESEMPKHKHAKTRTKGGP